METSGSDAADAYLRKAEDRDYDLEHLPPLLEDEVRGSGVFKRKKL